MSPELVLAAIVAVTVVVIALVVVSVGPRTLVVVVGCVVMLVVA